MTYVSEFDKVHYPLPLNFEENPDVDTLKATIKRLQTELEESKSRSISQASGENFFMTQDKNNHSEVRISTSSSDVSILKTENEELKKKIKNMEEQSMMNTASSINSKKGGAVEYDIVLKTKLDLENEVENIKKEYVRDVGKLKKKCEEYEKELNETRSEILRIRDSDSESDISRKGGPNSARDDFSFSKKMINKH
mmetsp:Transcript_18038/g.15754  ORF Transcript_18038/g.15754 Transcript_18038/m.15754 type:complete len:196 (-) Transcript_18038:645-1232(-)|eukprot:CAMPEP_0114588842 /NCGR_PEP_ID=MMETSP0125-20121206/11450_1 /TAXON_ID=485358 ORGANISM="Aristerostoma sp., Strain ATCC 50986" /NCGR_SAMPLE_ID=MMETSP0125 /ASSEMBLY_ACC=CAM_ASM_000245 /LENGTH=195 /DNA_ID=CAMNT_0001785453 /DNA_START=321 /DNA_END=908 /DNA_ORIENTATION=-